MAMINHGRRFTYKPTIIRAKIINGPPPVAAKPYIVNQTAGKEEARRCRLQYLPIIRGRPRIVASIADYVVIPVRISGATYNYRIPYNNFAATRDPTPSDDGSYGYGPGSRWINTVSQNEFACITGKPGAAVWLCETNVGLFGKYFAWTAIDVTVSIGSAAVASVLALTVPAKSILLGCAMNVESTITLVTATNILLAYPSGDTLGFLGSGAKNSKSTTMLQPLIENSDTTVMLYSTDSSANFIGTMQNGSIRISLLYGTQAALPDA